jgi:hypothetical protein
MPKVISAYEKGCIKRCFSEYKKGRPDFTNDDIFKRLSHIFGVIFLIIFNNDVVILLCVIVGQQKFNN